VVAGGSGEVVWNSLMERLRRIRLGTEHLEAAP
jgi:hypothetical protein